MSSKISLHRLTGYKTGEVLALMGPSGSGKTTLLDVLARRAMRSNAKVSGSMLVNGQSISQPTFRSIASFVEQEDALMGSLTARETIEIAAHLSRPRSVLNIRSDPIIDLLAKVLESSATGSHRVSSHSLWPKLLL